MSSRTRKAPIANVGASVANHVLSLDDLRNIHKSSSKVKEAHIKDLGGVVYYRPVSASVVERFIEITTGAEEVSQKDMIRVLAEFASAALCNKDGSDFLSIDQAKEFSIETLSEVCAGIATGGTSGTRKGKGSRR